MKVEASNIALSSIIPLYRDFKALLRSVWSTLQKDELKCLLHDILARGMARVMVAAHDAAITAFLLTN